jgi:hypothetical protein
MTIKLAPLTEERKQEIMNDHLDGLWIVLNEEYQQDHGTPTDVLCGDAEGIAMLPAPR